MARRLLALTTALFALSAPSASAATICVPFGTDCDASSVSLQGAIDIADSVYPGTRDTIRLSAGNLTENADVGATNPVDIVGAGRGEDGTILRSPDNGFALRIESPGSTVSNVRVIIEDQSSLMFESGLDLSAQGVIADGITVLGEAGIDNGTGVQVRTGAILRNSLVEVPNDLANDALDAAPSTIIENVTASGASMVSAQDPGLPTVIRRLRSSRPSTRGIYVRGDAHVDISDALIRVSGGSSGGGLRAETASGSPSIVARQVTVVGTGDPADAGRGAYASGYTAAQTATIDVRDSIFHALTTDLEVEASSGGRARIEVGHSNFDPAKVLDLGAGDAQVNVGASNLLVNPGFVDAAALDFRLRADSQLIDRGFPGEGSTADLDGQPRPNDGNGDGLAVRDIGAFEYQRAPAPAPGPDTSAPLFRILSKALKLDRRGRVAVVLRGPANETAASTGAVALRSVRKLRASAAPRRRHIAIGRKRFSLPPSVRKVVQVKLSRKNLRRVRALKRLRVVLAVTARDAAGNSRTARKTVSLRAARMRR